MKKLEHLKNDELIQISREISDAFYDYPYCDEDLGLKKYIKTREDMFIYMKAIVQAACRSGLLYTTSDRQEGYLILSGEGSGSVRFMDGMKMIFAEMKALGGYSNMKRFISACFSDGNTIETRMRKSKRKFIKVEMLAVRSEYQKQGYMRNMLEEVFRMADQKHIPVILDTDDKNKCLRYEHLGMTLERVRNCGNRFHMYDLIREPGQII